MLDWLIKHDIEPHIPVRDNSRRRDGTFSRKDFRFDKDRDLYTCPGDKVLRTTGRVHEGRTLLYRASKRDCQRCPLKPRCCPKVPERKVPRDINEDARDYARSLVDTEPYERSRREHKKVEMLFAHLNSNLRFERLMVPA